MCRGAARGAGPSHHHLYYPSRRQSSPAFALLVDALRHNKLANRVFDAHDAILDACCDAWTWLMHQPERIAALASRPWARVND